MTETKHAFRVLDDVGTPDLWERIESGTPRGDDPEPARPMWRRVAPVAIAAVITAAIVFVLSSAFRADDTVTPAVPASPAIGAVQDVALGAPVVLPVAQEGGFTSAREAFGSLWTVEILSGVEQLQRRNIESGAMETTFSHPRFRRRRVGWRRHRGRSRQRLGQGPEQRDGLRDRSSDRCSGAVPSRRPGCVRHRDRRAGSGVGIRIRTGRWRRDRPTRPRVWTGDPR